jgi:hypothetical protein
MAEMLVFAAEIPADHIAAQLAIPLALLFFSGSVYLLLWSIYGAAKGALIYGTAFFAFSAMIGLFWWFGAPGTPQGTGVRYFPGQEVNRYVARWYPMEPGSDRADFFGSTNDLEALQTPEEYLGLEGMDEEELAAHPAFRELVGDLDTAVGAMLSLYLPIVDGSPRIGADRRRELNARAAEIAERLADDFVEDTISQQPFIARARPHPEDPTRVDVRVTDENRVRVAGAMLEVHAVFLGEDPDTGEFERVTEPIEEAVWFAFKDPGALWFPSAVWTGVSLILFLACLLGLDAFEMREKRRIAEREPVA